MVSLFLKHNIRTCESVNCFGQNTFSIHLFIYEHLSIYIIFSRYIIINCQSCNHCSLINTYSKTVHLNTKRRVLTTRPSSSSLHFLMLMSSISFARDKECTGHRKNGQCPPECRYGLFMINDNQTDDSCDANINKIAQRKMKVGFKVFNN